MKELIKTFRKHGTTLLLYKYAQSVENDPWLIYKFKVGRKLIFSGQSFCPSPLHAIDSIETVRALMTFILLKKGDTDAEYFDNYTEEQLEFSESETADRLRVWLYSARTKL